MAYINDSFETSSGKRVNVKVPSSRGGQDRTIYVDGRDIGYKLGQGNDKVYTKHGSEVSKALRDFVKISLWDLFKEILLKSLFILLNLKLKIIKKKHFQRKCFFWLFLIIQRNY